MTPGEILSLLRVAKPPAPYGAKRLARCYSIEDVARVARRRLPLGARAYLETGGEGEYTLRRNRAAVDLLEFLPTQLATTSLEDVAAQTGTPLWFQLYVWGGPRRDQGGGLPCQGGRVQRAAAQHRHRGEVQARAGKARRP